MRMITSGEVAAALDFPGLIDRLAEAFRSEIAVPLRHHHAVSVPGGSEGTLLLMPAWQSGRHIGIKIVTVFPDNGQRSLPSVMGVYLLLDGMTGAPVALLDGPTLTTRRTAATSALAARYLARPDARRLVMVGTGAMAPQLITAHATVRPVREVLVWGRSPEKAEALAAKLTLPDVTIRATEDLEAAVRDADIVSCATLSTEPLVHGRWLRPGTHLDLVGAFTPRMREADDDAIRAAKIFVDTREGALKEAGDIVRPIQAGVLSESGIEADLFDLTRGTHPGRRSAEEITLFKSVGTALEDLAAAQLAAERR